MYEYPVGVEAPDEVAVIRVDWEVVVVAVFIDGPYVDVVEGVIDESDDEESGKLIEEPDDRTEPLAFGIMG
jgi:hypothetical protein